jgi:NTP pyrophosphatase (non-canonical NTP hydrolase)
MDVATLRDRLVEAVKRKFPNEFSAQQRFISVVTQMGELGDLILISDKVKENHKQLHNSPQQALVDVMIDLLILSKMLDVDIEKEIEKALEWFNQPTAHE